MKKLLCIGGPLDGKYHQAQLPYPLSARVPIISGPFLSILRGYFTKRRIVIHEYWLTTLHLSPDGIETAVYRHNSLSFQEAVQRLISHYRP